MYHGGQVRDILEVSKMGVKTIQEFRHLGSFTYPLRSSPSPGDFVTNVKQVNR